MALDAVLVLGIALYVLFVSKVFLGPFIAFLIFCGVFLAAWAAIFMVDFYRLRRRAGYPEADLFRESGANRTALGCWIVGALAGLMVSKPVLSTDLSRSVFSRTPASGYSSLLF
ncbi:MAG: cytosine permease [Enterobacteriaceae bacterium]